MTQGQAQDAGPPVRSMMHPLVVLLALTQSPTPPAEVPSDAATAVRLHLQPEALAKIREWRPITNQELLDMPQARLQRILQRVFAPRPDKPDLAAAWRSMFHRGADGSTPDDALLQARAAFDALHTEGAAGGLDSGLWTEHGPRNIGGRVRALAIDPRDGNRMFAGSVSGGIWRSNDGGGTWARANDLLENLAITSIVIDPSNADRMYASTGEGYWEDTYQHGRVAPAIRGAGIFMSTDGGGVWARIASTANANFHWVNRIAVGPGGVLLAATSTGIHRTADQGTSWTLVHQASANARYYEVDFHPTDGQRAVAHVKNLAGGNWTSRVIHSDDGGRTWADSNLSVASDRKTGRIELAYHRGYTGPGGGCVYACADSANGKLFRSIDGGATFMEVSTPGHLNGVGWFANALWVDPSDADADPADDHVIVGGLELHRSTDGGASWTQISVWNPPAGSISAHADHHFVLEQNNFDWDTAGRRRVYFANDGGVFSTDDVTAVGQASGWTPRNSSLAITQFYGGARAVDGVLHGGTQDNGTVRSTGSGAWATTFGGDGGFTACDPTDARYVYSEYICGQAYRSADGGDNIEWICGMRNDSTWKAAPYRIEDARTCTANFIAPLVLDHNDPKRLFVGGVSLWRCPDARVANTLNAGPLWAAIKGPAAGNAPISAIVVAKRRPDVIWVGHNDGKLFSTADGTAANPTWTARGAGNPGRVVSRITIDDNNPQRIFVTYGGFETDNVWLSTDGGATFGARPMAVAVPVRDIEVQPANPDWWYAATEVGLLVTENAGTTWSSAATPANVAIDELFIGGNGKLHLVTHGRGMFSQGNFSNVRNLGGGCRHPNTPGGPTLTSTRIVMNQTVTFTIAGGPAVGYAALLATVMPNTPFAWTPSCTIHVFGPFGAINLVGFPVAGGAGMLSMPVGNHPPAAGLGLVFQAAVVDVMNLGLYLSNGVLAVVEG